MSYKAKRIIIHCSDSDWGTVEDIRRWHLEFGWKDIGYNGVIRNGVDSKDSEYNILNDGLFEEGRSLDFSKYVEKEEKAAHTLGYNKDSIGICLIGKHIFTIRQFEVLYNFCKVFKAINPEIEINGHYEMSTANGKTCPNFDINIFRGILKDHTYMGSLHSAIRLNLPTKDVGFTI